MAKGRLCRVANGHLSFEIEDAPSGDLFPILSLLESRFGLRAAPPALGLDEIVSEGRIGETRIAAGYDVWSGVYVMAFDEAGDAIVARIAEFLEAEPDSAEPPPPGEPPAPPAAPAPPR